MNSRYILIGAIIAAVSVASLYTSVTQKPKIVHNAGNAIPGEIEIREILSHEGGGIHGYNRVSGMLTDILREQKRLFKNANGDVPNEIADSVEAMVNDAGLYASQNDYGKCFKSLEEALDTLTIEMAKLNGK